MRIHGPARTLFDAAARGLHRRALRRRGEELRLQGLRGPVEIVTDRWGVAHIQADTREDLFFAQGYVTARDRLFQMDYNRHAARGRLCELVGRRPVPWRKLTVHLRDKTTFDVDVMLRTFGIERAARASLEVLSPQARSVLDAYTAGVNAYLARLPWTLEHAVLRLQAPAWTPLDSLVLIKAVGFELNYAWRAVLLGALLQEARIPEDVARVLWPHFPSDGAPIVTSEAWRAVVQDAAATAVAADAALGVSSRPGAGSNCWAVAGRHTESGGALLANDTHLAFTIPQPWYEVRLQGGGLDLRGFALPGLPGIGIGRTPHFAWGITAGLVQDLDLFLEEIDPAHPTRYRTPEGWAEMETRREVFRVRGEGFIERPICFTRHGPVLETVATTPAPPYRLAIAWTGHEPSSEIDALLELWTAQDLAGAQRALRHHGCPTYNITYAGADGTVAYILAGRIPKRRLGAPVRPLEGWTGAWDWEGTVPHEHNPREIDPDRGYVITANNRVGPADYPYELGSLFEPPHRFERIRQRLTALIGAGAVGLDDMQRLQTDAHAGWAVAARDRLLEVLGGRSGVLALVGDGPSSSAPLAGAPARAAIDLWLDWDGEASRDSAGAAVAYAVTSFFGEEVVRRLAGESAAIAFLEMGSFTGPPILDLLGMEERLAQLGLDLRRLVAESLRRAVAHLTQTLGPDPTGWRWGRLHALVIPHRLSGTPLGPFLSVGPEEAPGGPDTVDRGDFNAAAGFGYRVGPALRFVTDAARPDSSRTVIPGGQSGARASPHYDDQVRLFLSGELKAAPMQTEGVEAESRERWLPPER